MEYKKSDCEKLAELTVDLAQLLLGNGAEVSLVEEAMRRVVAAYGYGPGEIFVIPSCICTTITGKDGRAVTRIRRLHTRDNDMEKIRLAAALVRFVCRETPEFSQARVRIDQIKRLEPYPLSIQILAYSLISFSFASFFGAGLSDACCSLVCGALVKLADTGLRVVRANAFFSNLVLGWLTALSALLFGWIGWGEDLDTIIIGTLMTVVPGVVITSFMRDMLSGDLAAGLLRFTESLLTAAAIALGAGLALLLPPALAGR